MKVGIVTLYDFYNHGNRLQNYALEQALKKLGHEPHSLAIASKKYLPICYGLTRIFPVISTTQRLIKSMKFTKNDLNSKNITFTSTRNMKKFFSDEGYKGIKLDYVAVGSDQVFNPAFILDYSKTFLEFAPANRRLAYSASFGITKLPAKYEERFKEGLSNMPNISIREKEGTRIVKELIGKDVPVVVDPTMLLEKSDWEVFAGEVDPKRLPKEKYIVTYFLTPDKEYKTKVKEFSNKFGLKVYNINTLGDKYFSANSKEFIALIKNAEFVCTNSFHGHALSIVMEKPFVSFPSVRSKNSRIKTLLEITGLQERDYKTLKEEDILKIDYSKTKAIIEKEREKGLNFLKNALKNVEENN